MKNPTLPSLKRYRAHLVSEMTELKRKCRSTKTSNTDRSALLRYIEKWLRPELRAINLAYGFLTGQPRIAIEPRTSELMDSSLEKRVISLMQAYGRPDYGRQHYPSVQSLPAGYDRPVFYINDPKSPPVDSFIPEGTVPYVRVMACMTPLRVDGHVSFGFSHMQRTEERYLRFSIEDNTVSMEECSIMDIQPGDLYGTLFKPCVRYPTATPVDQLKTNLSFAALRVAGFTEGTQIDKDRSVPILRLWESKIRAAIILP